MSKLILFVLVVAGITVVASTSRSDDLDATTEAPPDVDLSFPAPTTPLGISHLTDSTAFDFGPPNAAWHYDQLSVAEKALVDRGRQPQGTQAETDAYHAAMAELAAQSNAVMAARMLDIDGLGVLGVVP